MCRILIFGGTTEGRLLAQWCARKNHPVWVSVASDYGKELLPESPWIRVHQGTMTAAEMADFIRQHRIGLAVDATHPHARRVSWEIFRACEATGIRLERCLREEGGGEEDLEHLYPGGIVEVSSVEEAAAYLKFRSGRVFITTGSHGLWAFQRIENFSERAYVRVLPSSKALADCEALGLRGSHVIAMQGPSTEAMNRLLLEELGIQWMVTKDSGRAGGFFEKIQAARACRVPVLVIRRPRESGKTFQEICGILEEFMEQRPEAFPVVPDRVYERCEQQFFLIGIGMGNLDQLTCEAKKALMQSDVVFGAPRMLEAVRPLFEMGKSPVWIERYRTGEILDEVNQHPEWQHISVVFSGDTGFFSGASEAARILKERGMAFSLFPGISCVSYLASRLGVSWGDAGLYSCHGRALEVKTVMEAEQPRVFVLLGGKNGAGHFCRALCEAGYGKTEIHVGERLSYPDERIVSGTAEELAGETFAELGLLLVVKG